MLILFDIDATLVTTTRSGVYALEEAGRELHGAGFTVEGVEFAGRLDPLIIADLLVRNGVEASGANAKAMRDGYRKYLERRLAKPGVARALPGVHAVVDGVAASVGATLGLLTGNFADTGEMKLRACGIEPGRFVVKVWGDESPHSPAARHHLGAIGLERYCKLRGSVVDPRTVTIVGDTPHDVDCAKKNGARCLAVATGSYSMEALRDSGADLVVKDMSDVERVVAWLVGNQ